MVQTSGHCFALLFAQKVMEVQTQGSQGVCYKTLAEAHLKPAMALKLVRTATVL